VAGSERSLMRPLMVFVLFLLVGAPASLVIWHNVSELLAGRPHPGGLLLSTALLAAFLVLARLLARYVIRLSEAV